MRPKKGKRPFKDSGWLGAANALADLFPGDKSLRELTSTFKALDSLSVAAKQIDEALGTPKIQTFAEFTPSQLPAETALSPVLAKVEQKQELVIEALKEVTDRLRELQTNQIGILQLQKGQDLKSNAGLIVGTVGTLVGIAALIKAFGWV